MKAQNDFQLERIRTLHIAESERLLVNLQLAVQNSKNISRLSTELQSLHAELAAIQKDTHSLIAKLNELAVKYGLEPIENNHGKS